MAKAAGSGGDDVAKALAAMSAGGHEERAAQPEPSNAAGAVELTQASPVVEKKVVAGAAARALAAGAERTVELKRTIIPVLLSMGGVLALWAAVTLAMGDAAPIELGVGLAWGMLLAGLGMLAVAAVNMMQVREALQREGMKGAGAKPASA